MTEHNRPKTYDFDTIIDRRNTCSLKWDRYQNKDIIPMWVADMDFKAPPAVIDALHRRVDHGVFGYPKVPRELRDAVVERMERLYAWKIDPGWIVWIPGLVCGINIACRAVGSPGDEVMTTTPVYPPFLSAPAHSGKLLRTVPMVEKEGRWTLDFDGIAQAISDRTKLFLLCSPYNPCGTLFTRGELSQLSEICNRHDVILCSDEIHCDLVLDPYKQHVPVASTDGASADNTITLMAPSKTFNIPGLGCSFAIIRNKDLKQRFLSAMDGIVPHVNVLGYTAALAAYTDGGDWLDQCLAYLKGNRDLLEEEINNIPGLKLSPVEATYLAWIDVRDAGLEDPAAFFEQAGVGLSSGSDFGSPGFVRLNFGCPRSVLQEALERIKTAFKDRKDEHVS